MTRWKGRGFTRGQAEPTMLGSTPSYFQQGDLRTRHSRHGA